MLTTAQVAEVGFTGERRARMRLSELYALDILDRFRPQAWGKPSPFHWVLGPLGAALMAAEAGVVLADLSWRRSLVHDLAASQRIAHLVGLNGFFYCLFGSARTRPAAGSTSGGPTALCPRVGEVVRPDGYGIWTETDTSLPFLLEYDNGSERLERLAGTGHLRGVDVREFAPLTEHDDLGVLSDSDRRHETTRPRSRHKPR